VLKILSEQIFQKIRLFGSQVSEISSRQVKELNSQLEMNRTNLKKYEELLAQERKVNEERLKEKSELFASKIELESKYERLNREMNSKRKEYEEMLKIEGQKLQNLKSYYETSISEKESLANKQEKKIESLNNRISQLMADLNSKALAYSKEITDKYVEIETLKGKDKNHKSETANDYKLNTLKAVFKSFQSVEMEFKEVLEKLERDKENVVRT
jgi:chromosome segregation ATPase